MRLGVQLPVGATIPERVALAVWAESNGFDDVWTAEIGDPDAFVVLAAVAGATARVRIGTMIVPLGTRSVPTMAAAASSVCELAPGRVALGLGVSTPAVIAGWNGADFAQPLTRVRETFSLLNTIFAGDKTSFDGATMHSHGFRLNHPPAPAPHLSLAALNRNMLRLAGAVADGVWLNFVPLEALPRVLAVIDEGCVDAGRTSRPEILMSLVTRVTDDVDALIERYRSWFKFYMSAESYRKALAWYGYEDDVNRARSAIDAGDRAALAHAASVRLVRGLTAFGSAEYCRERVNSYAAAGVDTMVVIPYDGDHLGTLGAFAGWRGAAAVRSQTAVGA